MQRNRCSFSLAATCPMEPAADSEDHVYRELAHTFGAGFWRFRSGRTPRVHDRRNVSLNDFEQLIC
jgi:radical SAM superfamily enzyme with C-terminal helix-hairpin-helix motif